MACSVPVAEPPLRVILLSESKVFPSVQEQAIGKSTRYIFVGFTFESSSLRRQVQPQEREKGLAKGRNRKAAAANPFPFSQACFVTRPWGWEARFSQEEEEPVPISQAQAPQVETHLYVCHIVQTDFIPTCFKTQKFLLESFFKCGQWPTVRREGPCNPKIHFIIGWRSIDQECLTRNFSGVLLKVPEVSLLIACWVWMWCTTKKSVCHTILTMLVSLLCMCS